MDYFRQIKEAIAAAPESSLRSLGIKPAKGGSGGWKSAVCPCCADTDGSARFTEKGFLRCFQCDRRLDVFDWWCDAHGMNDSYEAAKQIGQVLNIPLPRKIPKSKRKVAKMTPAVLAEATRCLLEDEEAGWARKHFQDAKLWNPHRMAEFGIGFMNGAIIYAQRHPNGELRARFRSYRPFAKPKWMWSKGEGPPNGFWPWHEEIPEDAIIMLCEGEKDVQAAYELGNALKLNIYAYTWTGGASSPISSRLMPDAWRGRDVIIVYDNDTFQGPDVKTHRAPDMTKVKDMLRRRVNLIENVAAVFAANNCKVEIAAVPIDPVDNFGADLRDWLTRKKEIQDLPRWPLGEMVDPEQDPKEIEFSDVRDHLGDFVKLQGAVNSVKQMMAVVPKKVTIKCPMNHKAACQNCGVPNRHANGEFVTKQWGKQMIEAFKSDDPDAHMMKHILGKPTGCNECDLVYEETWAGAAWSMSPVQDGTKQMPVLSTSTPSFAGELAVTGYVHPVHAGVGMFVTHLEQLDKPVFDIDTFHNDLQMVTPWGSNNEDKIWDHVNGIVDDLSQNVTQIYGRPELHILVLLVAHSVLRYKIDDHLFRGWLDACSFGHTRQGKSETIKRILEFLQVGQSFTCMDNFSRAGLTIGGGKNQEMILGIFPKSHGKLLFFDEFHHMSSGKGENPMVCLQSARDEGMVSAAKIYGTTKVAAACRLITAGNWFERQRSTLLYPAQHVLQFYGVPEALGRMDFAWCVKDPAHMDKHDVEHVWHQELLRALVLRAWAMEPHMVHIEPEAWRLAEQQAKEWDDIYAAALPLHTGAEKAHSITRIANAFACISYSHPAGKPRECLTRVGHVRCAIDWLVRCWENLEYDQYSQRERMAQKVKRPFDVEVYYSVHLGLRDHDEAEAILPELLQAQDIRELEFKVTGSGKVTERNHFLLWLNKLKRLNACQVQSGGYVQKFTPTEGGASILKNLLILARDNPAEYVHRYDIMSEWWERSTGGPGEKPPPQGLSPLDEDFEQPDFNDGNPTIPFA